MAFQSGVLEKTRIVSNILLIVLVAGNIFFSVQYIENLKEQANQKVDDTSTRILISRYLNFFIKTVLNTQGTISFDDRVKLENDVRQIHDADLTNLWEKFVNSKDSKEAQANSVNLMLMLSNKML